MEGAPHSRLRRQSAGLAIAALLAVACGESSEQRLAQTPTRAPSTTTEHTQPASSMPEGTAQQVPPVVNCERPLLPEYVSSTYSRPPDPGAPPEGESLDYPGARLPDTDGDGAADSIAEAPSALEVVRGDGTVELVRDGGTVLSLQHGRHYVGDLDGDGRDELLLGVYTGSQVEGTYLVPGTVEPGSHDPADVGIRIAPPRGNVLERWFPVGDQDRDGAADLSRGKTELYSGRDLMDAVPGEDLGDLPSPFRSFEQPWLGLLQLDPDDPPTFVEGTSSAGDAAELHVLSDPAICLHTDTIPVPATSTSQSASVSGFMSGSDRIVSFSYNQRGSAAVYMWNLGPSP